MNAFPTTHPGALELRPRHKRWLVDELWGYQAVGIVGGEPKCGKSFLALAVSVAAGVPALRHFPAAHPGSVLMYAAEDAGHIVRSRLEAIARAAGTALERLDIAVIDVPALRLDQRDDRQRLHHTVGRLNPTPPRSPIPHNSASCGYSPKPASRCRSARSADVPKLVPYRHRPGHGPVAVPRA